LLERWLTDHTAAGIEGVVVKALDGPYRPGARNWRKVRTRTTAEAIVGGVLGPLNAPDCLVVGRPDDHGRLRIAGCTGLLSAKAKREVATTLQPPRGNHPWPDAIPSSRFGQHPNQPIPYTRVAPNVVVELDVDAAYEHGRWRHPTRYRRVRPDLTADDVV
jgi:ATP-dependent DNA ligase